MSNRVLTIIWIGGQLNESGTQILVDAINKSHVYAHGGDTIFKPNGAGSLSDPLSQLFRTSH